MANFNDLTLLERDDTPSLPMAGKMKIYAKTDKNIYKLDSDGIETLLGAAGPPAPDEGLFGWGYNGGNGANGSLIYTDPAIVTEDEFLMVSIGSTHALGIKADGTLWALGSNGSGKTGLNVDNSIPASPWTQIGTGTDWALCSAGGAHSAAIKTNGTLWTWGSRSNGRLGDGNTSGSTLVPTQVGSDTNWEYVACGLDATIAIKGGQLLACGNNASAKTGLNTTSGNTTTFTVSNSSTDWKKCYIGDSHGLAIKGNSNPTLWSWGSNTNGRTGQGVTTGQTLVPTQVGSITGFTRAVAGQSHSMAIADGKLYAFGAQARGRLGNGNTAVASISTPAQIGSDSDWQDVAACSGLSSTTGYVEFSYAIKAGELYATGYNLVGALGASQSFTEFGSFVKIAIGTNFIQCAAGGACGMAIRKNP